MKVYYQDDSCTIYHGDCRGILPDLNQQSIDLVLTDPPYFKVKDEPWDRAWKSADSFIEWLGLVADEWQRVLKPNGSLYCFAGPRLSGRVETMLGQRFNVLNRIRWMKPNGDAGRRNGPEALRRYRSCWEEVIFAEQYGDRYAYPSKALYRDVYVPLGRYIQQERKRAGWSTNDVETALGYVERNRPERGSRLCGRWEEGASMPTKEAYERLRDVLNRGGGEYLRREYEDLRRPFSLSGLTEDVWRFKTVSPYPGKHPCEKPLDMMEHIIKVSSRVGGTILDCFAGSGTTLEAAKGTGRRAIGIEAEEKYCEIAARRLQQEVLPLETA